MAPPRRVARFRIAEEETAGDTDESGEEWGDGRGLRGGVWGGDPTSCEVKSAGLILPPRPPPPTPLATTASRDSRDSMQKDFLSLVDMVPGTESSYSSLRSPPLAMFSVF